MVSAPASAGQEDLRGFLVRVEAAGKLRRVAAAELTAIPGLMREAEKAGMTLLVERVEGCQAAGDGEAAGACLAGHASNLLVTREHLVTAFSTGGVVGRGAIAPEFTRRTARLIPPVVMEHGPVQEVVKLGEEADVRAFPLLKHSPKDVDRYVTAGVVIARDPETGIRNASINRMQLKGPRKLGIRMMAPQHLGRIYEKAERLGRPLEVAVAVGVHPLDLLAASTSVAFGLDELGLAGSLRGEPLQLVRCRTVDLEVPAGAEVVIEGEVPPREREAEGPFGDFMQYYVPVMDNHVLHVRAITHRRHPLFGAIKAGSVEDTHLLACSREAAIYQAARETGTEVTAVNLGPTILNCAIAIRKRDEDEPRRVLEKAFGCYPWLKYCVVVDHDVDVFDLADVWWAMATRSAPGPGTLRLDAPGFPRDPYRLHQSKLGIDATAPLGRWEEFERTRGRQE